MRQGRWKEVRTVLGYIDEATRIPGQRRTGAITEKVLKINDKGVIFKKIHLSNREMQMKKVKKVKSQWRRFILTEPEQQFYYQQPIFDDEERSNFFVLDDDEARISC
jgi:hypothetical protein